MNSKTDVDPAPLDRPVGRCGVSEFVLRPKPDADVLDVYRDAGIAALQHGAARIDNSDCPGIMPSVVTGFDLVELVVSLGCLDRRIPPRCREGIVAPVAKVPAT